MTVSKRGFPNGSVSITNPADDLTRPPFSEEKLNVVAMLAKLRVRELEDGHRSQRHHVKARET